MRPSSTLLVGGLMLAACEDTGPSDNIGAPAEGTLVVSTSTGGGNPDPDGYTLTVDERDAFPLFASGTSELQLTSGHHALRLSGVADQCSVTPGVDLEVDVPPDGTASVAFDVACLGGTIQIATTTTGLDLDAEGYRVVVDGTDHGAIDPNGQLLTRLEPGSRTVTLVGLAANCAVEGPASRTVVVVDSEVVPVEFPVVCTATSGVVAISIQSTGEIVPLVLRATLDGSGALLVGSGGPYYFTDVPAGDHVVALVDGSPLCSVSSPSKPVTVTVGTLIRDTVAVEFSVACTPPANAATVRITAPTTGSLPGSTKYAVWYEHYEAWGYGGIPELLGTIDPNGSLVVKLHASTIGSGEDPYWHDIRLEDVPQRCTIQPDWFHNILMPNQTHELEFAVTC